MEHRHLNHQRFTLAAIDDVIARGKWQDWAELRRAALAEPAVLEKIRRVCAARIEPSAGEREGPAPRKKEPYAQRHHFWMHWTKRHAEPDDPDAPAS